MLGKTINTFKCQLFLFNYTQWKHHLEDSDGAFMTFVTIITNHVSEIMSSEGKVTKQWFLKPWMANKINGQLWGSSTTFAIYTFIYLFFVFSSPKLQQHIWSKCLFVSWWFREKLGPLWRLMKLLGCWRRCVPIILVSLLALSTSLYSQIQKWHQWTVLCTATNAPEYLKELKVGTSSLMRPNCLLGEDEWSFGTMSRKRFQRSCHLWFSHILWKSALECSYKKIVGINWIY